MADPAPLQTRRGWADEAPRPNAHGGSEIRVVRDERRKRLLIVSAAGLIAGEPLDREDRDLATLAGMAGELTTAASQRTRHRAPQTLPTPAHSSKNRSPQSSNAMNSSVQNVSSHDKTPTPEQRVLMQHASESQRSPQP